MCANAKASVDSAEQLNPRTSFKMNLDSERRLISLLFHRLFLPRCCSLIFFVGCKWEVLTKEDNVAREKGEAMNGIGKWPQYY